MTKTGSKYFYNEKESEKYEGVRTADNFSSFFFFEQMYTSVTYLSKKFVFSPKLHYYAMFSLQYWRFPANFVREKQQSSRCCCGQ